MHIYIHIYTYIYIHHSQKELRHFGPAKSVVYGDFGHFEIYQVFMYQTVLTFSNIYLLTSSPSFRLQLCGY